MELYEMIFIGRSDMTTAQVESLCVEYTNLIKSEGGSVSKTEMWGLRPLAYDIKKNSKGQYVLMHIKSQPGIVQEIERRMRLSQTILRYLTIKVDKHDINPSPIMRQKTYGEDRYGGQREDDADLYLDQNDRQRGDRGGFRGNNSSRPPKAKDSEEGVA